MNAVVAWLVFALIGWTAFGQAPAAPPPPKAATNAPTASTSATSVPTGPATSTPVVAPSLSDPPAEVPESMSTNVPPVSLALSPAYQEQPVVVAAPREEVQRRLEAPLPEVLIEKYGTAGFLIRQPEPRNFLEVINPFAPAEFGGKRREIYNRNPILKPGASLPRNFIRDGIRNEPDVMLIGWPW